MFIAKIIDTFSAAHSLRGYKGNCERLHGHNYRVELSVESATLDEQGIVMDFRELKLILKKTLDELDHHYLNDLEPFVQINPSAENIARHIYNKVSKEIKVPAVLKEVTIWESDSSLVTYLP